MRARTSGRVILSLFIALILELLLVLFSPMLIMSIWGWSPSAHPSKYEFPKLLLYILAVGIIPMTIIFLLLIIRHRAAGNSSEA